MKRGWWLALAGALMLIGAARAEGALCVVTDGFAALVDEAGRTVVEGVEDAFCVRESALYAVGSRGAYRLCDEAGNVLGETTFAMIDDAGDCLIYRQGNLCGAMDEDGNVILPAEWMQLVSDGSGGFLALDTDPLDESADAILHVDADGEATATGAKTASGLTRLESGLMPVMASNGRCGAVNARGEWAIRPEWRYIGPFEEGCAKAAGAGGIGLVDASGEEIISARFDWLERGGNVVAALDENGVDVFSKDGDARLYSVKGRDLEAALVGDCLLVKSGDSSRLYSATGSLMGAFGADFRCAPGLRGQLIATEGEWGSRGSWLMDTDGSAASGRFQRILPLAGERYAFIETPGIEYYSADLDRVQTSWDYDAARVGLMDASGAVILPAQYREIRALGEDRLLMRTDEEVRLTDLNGNVLRTWLTAGGEAATGE